MADVLLEVPISAPPERVYQAITEQAGLARGWTPDVSKAEPRIGSVAEFRFGTGYVVKVEVAALESGRRAAWSVRQGAPEMGEQPGHLGPGAHRTWYHAAFRPS
jgi:uncharacterized protein YndB with AHSA1/START domain